MSLLHFETVSSSQKSYEQNKRCTKHYVIVFCLIIVVFFFAEQQYFDLEKQLISSNTKLEAESSANVQLREQIADLGLYINLYTCSVYGYGKSF